MTVNKISFVGSFPRVTKCPKKEDPEYAFIGRSNVGKSSLINAMVDRSNLAHTSGKPGKTQLLNFYKVNDSWMICDLPGYGYAKLSKKHRASLEKMVRSYLERRIQLQCAFVLIDSNIPPQQIDLEFINWLGANGIPFVIVFTKADKPKKKKLEANIEAFQAAMLENWAEMPQQFITSSQEKTGTEEILSFIEDINTQFFESL
ncbi:MAG: YihA family ribosome biogenesis GTP-binding protein [Bacteroidetes bacterium]|nr:YihA family ribosome biogenesis GTP-binding protein [Bacteroidota bacterium]